MPFDPITAAMDLGGKLIDRLIPDPAQKAQAALNLLQLQQSGQLAQLTADTDLAKAQIAVDQVEAASPNWFVSGWRPAAGWTCVGGIAYQVIFRPILGWIAFNLWHWTMPPSLEIDTLGTILFGMLGLGAYRMNEKLNGVAAK